MGVRKNNVVLCKAKDFAVRIVRLYKFLSFQKSERVISTQLLKSGTSIGANLNEAQESISAKEFEAKIYIALKEARETEYWLELLFRTDYLNEEEYNSMLIDCQEILKLLVSITKSLRSKYIEF